MQDDDDDRTSPDLGADEHTDPGAGPFASIAGSLGAVVGDVRTLAATCPGSEEPGYVRHLIVLGNSLGALGDLAHDTRRAINALIRERTSK